MKSTVTLFFSALLLVCGILFTSESTSAQSGRRVSRYTVTNFTASLTSIATTGSVIASGNLDDNVYGITLPFNFNYDSSVFSAGSTFYINSNGNASFLSSSSGCCSNYLGTTTELAAMCIWSSDAYVNGALYQQVTGIAPNRIWTLEWNGIRQYSGNTSNINMQMKLYESNNAIEYYFAPNSFTFSTSTSASYQGGIGLNGTSTNGFQYIVYYNNAVYSVNGAIIGHTVTPSNQIRWTPLPPGPNVQLGLPQPRSYNFGSFGTGQSSTYAITVQNVGTNTFGPPMLSIKNVSITGDPDFTILSYPASSDSIVMNDTRPIVVKFSPIIDGPRTATVTIVSNGIDSGTQQFSLNGVGLAPLISVDTNVLFKNKFVKLGDSLIGRIIISSTNSPTLFLNGFQFVGIDSGEYRISRYPTNMQIPGGTSDSLFITYKPTKEGRHVASLNILNNSINNPILPITLFGTAVLPHIVVTPNPLRFDSVFMGSDTCKSVRVYNPGSDTLLIKANSLISNDGDFRFTMLTGVDTIIPPDKFKDITICFKPVQKGTRVARLRLVTNIPKTFEQIPRDTAGQFLVDISGTGVPSSELGQSIGFGEPNGWMDSVLIGKTICTTDSLTNTGDADILITSITFNGTNASEYKINPAVTLPITLKAKAKMTIGICATPQARGVRNATLAIKGTMNEKPFTSNATLAVTGLLACAEALPTELFMNTLLPISDTSMLTLCDTVTNCGDITATYVATVSGAKAANYTVAPLQVQNVPPGGTAVFCVTYKPTARENSPATLTISTADTPNQSVGLGGKGGCSELTATIAGNGGPFGKGGHYPITVTISNIGEIDWVPDAGNPIIIGVGAGLLTPTGTPITTIPAGGQIQLTFDFAPQDISTPFNIAIGFIGGPCRDTTGVQLEGSTNTSSVSEFISQAGFTLGVNHPNPFVSATQFIYTTPAEASVTLSLHDITGKLVRTISTGHVSSGEHTVVFEAGNLASGTYLLMLESNGIQLSRQIVISK